MNKEVIIKSVRAILEAIGEDPEREGLVRTPERVANMYVELFSGMGVDPEKVINVQFNEPHEEMIIVKDIPFSSMCEHHMIPFIGKAHIVYIPQDNKITGLSKLIRLVDLYSKRLQLQERLTTQVADSLMKTLNPLGVVVVIEAEHMCMSIRGVKKPGSKTITSAVRGIFHNDIAARSEALSLIREY
ncbi:MAG: GTP cyclohydrolase I FolE [Candidatus Muiribacterium halophilum]|uniref:GTP cyclohydrolase 1 n=1 Tax=Muiribacterium halophilum TaxID=2053465 RepID=A0A2N5Z9B6_MUIH1|nr:MAG: GTP cyclohydrolase I FolE [Candidatus Muirbacterium halophilum]